MIKTRHLLPLHRKMLIVVGRNVMANYRKVFEICQN